MKKWLLVILLVMFLAPGVLAYVFYLHPAWIASPTTNRGQLISPAVLVPGIFELKNKWHIVLWNPGNCSKKCMDHLNQLTRVRLALGRRLYNVDLCLLRSDTPAILVNHRILKQHNICDMQALSTTRALLGLTDTAAIFIVNPKNYWVLRYQETAPLDDLYHDVKQLLVQGE